MLEDIKQGNTRTKWKDRVPYAYWRGNPSVAPTRNDLLKCNVSDKDDWNTHLYIQVNINSSCLLTDVDHSPTYICCKKNLMCSNFRIGCKNLNKVTNNQI